MIPEGLDTAIRSAIETAVEEEVRKTLEAAKASLDRRIPEIVAGLVIRVQQRISLERMGTDLHIVISMRETT